MFPVIGRKQKFHKYDATWHLLKVESFLTLSGFEAAKSETMASARARVTFRVVLAILVIVGLFYIFRPLYWKISATVQDIRENKQTVSGGISQIVYEAQKSVGWYRNGANSGPRNQKVAAMTTRRILGQVL
ncbi:hypothetical protein NMG60_11025187 [Bertholletia excelsa]